MRTRAIAQCLTLILINALLIGCVSSRTPLNTQPGPTSYEIYKRTMFPNELVAGIGVDCCTQREATATASEWHIYVPAHVDESTGVVIPGFWTTTSTVEAPKSPES